VRLDRPALELPSLPVPNSAPGRGRAARWLLQGGTLDAAAHDTHGHPWYRVLWLTGVDYFSTLGYQPGIALLAAGAISPIATLLLILVTLFGALPVYAQVARRSFAGQGSIAMLENLLPGWGGKLFVLALLGFAATDFVITMTLSAADAAKHAIENPFLHAHIGDHQMLFSLLLLATLAAVFLKGFKEAIGVASVLTIPYLLLNVVVLSRGFLEILRHPELVERWNGQLALHGDWAMMLGAAALVFPKLALGLSGFETGVAVMPQISGGKSGATADLAPAAGQEAREGASAHDDAAPPAVPMGRVRATRKLLLTAALIMSVLLLGSSFVTTLLLRPEDVAENGPASGRALAYLAHELLGNGFGSIYDIATIAILWFAGASAMAGLLNVVPRYLPRFGMAPRWVAFARPLVLVLFTIDAVVTVVFRANVEAQGGAYATGVLVLILSASVAVALALWREAAAAESAARRRTRLQSLYFWGVSAVFAFTLVDNVIERPDGIIVASVFIVMIIGLGAVSRYIRASELRVEHMTFADEESAALWPAIVGKKVHLVSLKKADAAARARKQTEIQQHYRTTGPFAFVHVDLLDNRSEFLAPLRVHVRRNGANFDIALTGAVAVANSLAYLSELMDPVAIYLALTRQNLMTQSLRYFLFGEGEVGLSVYSILVRYWEWTPEDDVRPLIFLMSE